MSRPIGSRPTPFRPTRRAVLWLLPLLAACLFASALHAGQTERVVLVIIDGLRYTEGFGDPTRANIPEMAAIAQQGTLVGTFRNNYYTYTSRAVPAIWCGAWTPMIEFSDPACGGYTNSHSELPSLFEYYRKGLSRPASDCYYVLKYLCSWKGSFHADYGSAYWPTYHTVGSTDTDVWNQAQSVLAVQSPRFMLLYLADVDHAGHSGVWADYIAAISTADDIVGQLWQTLQTDPDYAGKTTMIVTNDHGRHTTDFSGHGDSCEGCRRIQLLAVGPDIKAGYVSQVTRIIPDIVPTIGELLGFPTPLATGTVMAEILKPQTGVEDTEAAARSAVLRVFPNPLSGTAEVRFTLSAAGPAACRVHDLSGREVATLFDGESPAGETLLRWDGRGAGGNALAAGVYFVILRTPKETAAHRVLLLP